MNRYQQAINNAVAAKLPESEIFAAAQRFMKMGHKVEIRFPNRSPNRNNIATLRPNSGSSERAGVRRI